MKPYLIVSGDFVKTGGMDRANYALAEHLATTGNEVHLVTCRADPQLALLKGLVVHRVMRPIGANVLAEPLLDLIGRRVARQVSERGGRVIVNGANCRWGDVNWVHYVHAVYYQSGGSGTLRRIKNRMFSDMARKRERRTLPLAQVLIANSDRTRNDLAGGLAIARERIKTVYYGIDSRLFRPTSAEQRSKARSALGWSPERLILVFVGGLGDHRKGFDTLFAAWQELGRNPQWHADLVVVGTGAMSQLWHKRVSDARLESNIRFLGARRDVPQILAAADAFVAPTRYEAYGLAVQEALCCGLPAFVSRDAGVAERYPPDLEGLLISDPTDPIELAERLREWHKSPQAFRSAVMPLARELCSHSWEEMAAQIVDAVEHAA